MDSGYIVTTASLNIRFDFHTFFSISKLLVKQALAIIQLLTMITMVGPVPAFMPVLIFISLLLLFSQLTEDVHPRCAPPGMKKLS